MLSDFGRNSIIRFSDAATDRSNCVAVATDGNRIPNCIFETCGFKKGHNCLRNRALARYIKLVIISNTIKCKIHWIVMLVNIVADFNNTTSCASQEDCHRCGFRAFYSLRVVVAYFGYQTGKPNYFFKAFSSKTASAYTHGSTISPAIVGVRIF